MSQKTALQKCKGSCTITIDQGALTVIPEVSYLCPYDVISLATLDIE
jgi:hypothetical protein